MSEMPRDIWVHPQDTMHGPGGKDRVHYIRRDYMVEVLKKMKINVLLGSEHTMPDGHKYLGIVLDALDALIEGK